MDRPQEIQPNGYYNELKDRLLTVKRGWNNAIANALVTQSHQGEIAAHFPRDTHKRFLDRESANRWAEQDSTRVVYTLALGRTAELAGLIWISQPEETIPGG